MKLIYSGKTKEFTPEFEEKIAGKLSKLSKHIEQRGEREAHITHQVVRHLHKICIEVKFYDHNVVAESSQTDLEAAACEAIEKLEVQILKLRDRWRATHRDPKAVRNSKENWEEPAGANGSTTVSHTPAANGTGKKPRIFRVNHEDGRKPMTLDEAILEMESSDDYVVYRDADRNCLSVLVRRPDGNFDLIQS
jgi:putative sigma-54 modulation protein